MKISSARNKFNYFQFMNHSTYFIHHLILSTISNTLAYSICVTDWTLVARAIGANLSNAHQCRALVYFFILSLYLRRYVSFRLSLTHHTHTHTHIAQSWPRRISRNIRKSPRSFSFRLCCLPFSLHSRHGAFSLSLDFFFLQLTAADYLSHCKTKIGRPLSPFATKSEDNTEISFRVPRKAHSRISSRNVMVRRYTWEEDIISDLRLNSHRVIN